MKKSGPATHFLPLSSRYARELWFRGRPGPGPLPLAEVAALVARIPDPGSSEVLLGGGEALLHPELPAILAALKAAGVERIRLETDGWPLAAGDRVERLAAAGVTGLLLNLVTPSPSACDSIFRVRGALPAVVRAVRQAAGLGLSVDARMTLLDPAVTDPEAAVALVSAVVPPTAGPSLAIGLPSHDDAYRPIPGVTPVPFSDYLEALDSAAARARAAGVGLLLPDRSGIPFCFAAGRPGVLPLFRFNPLARRRPEAGFHKPERCSACRYDRHCLGIHQAYRGAFGDGEIEPIPTRLAGLAGDNLHGRRRAWTEAGRRHAKSSNLRILRLLTACNQRCLFCPTDDSSENIIGDPVARLKKLYRWRRLGVAWVSFSGGEPTLAPELPRLISFARDIGIPDRELVTNAVRLADPGYTRLLVDNGLNRAFVSLHSHRPELSDAMTLRPGDFERTMAGLDNLLGHNIFTVINHVINRMNHPDLEGFVRFIHARYGARVIVSFAFITPLYRARQAGRDLIPRISEVIPSLHAALDAANGLGVSVLVLSRPGIPPCLLGERYVRYSDLADRTDQILAEDIDKKQKSPACADCLFDAACAGLWKGYVELYGTDELVPCRKLP